MDNRKFGTMILLLAFLLIVTVIVGCGNKRAGEATGSKSDQNQTGSVVNGSRNQSPVKLVIGYNIGSLTREIILETAFEKGFFKKQGLEIEDKGYTVGGQVIQDLAGGNLDIGLVGNSPSLIGAAQGADIKIIASVAKNDCPLVTRKGINTLKDLDGKKVGTPGPSSIQETMLNYLERKEGIKTNHVYGKAPDLVGYLEKGEIDAILAWEPVAANAVEKVGAHYLLDTAIPGAEAAEITVSGKLFREKPDVLVRFLKAMEDTRQYMIANTGERVKVAARMTSLPESVIAEGLQRSNLFLDNPEINMESLRLLALEDIDSGKLKGVTKQELDSFLAKVIDTTLLHKALSK